MKNKTILISFVALLILTTCAICLIQTSEDGPINNTPISVENPPIPNKNTTNSNLTTQKPKVYHGKTSSENINIILLVKGPKKAKKGQNVTILYIISNKGSHTINNIQIEGQAINKKLGTLKPKQTKKYAYTEYIPTDTEIKEKYGPDAEICNPYPIGGATIHFTDHNGKKHMLYFDILNLNLSDILF